MLKPEIEALEHFQQLDCPQSVCYIAVDRLQEVGVGEVIVDDQTIGPLSKSHALPPSAHNHPAARRSAVIPIHLNEMKLLHVTQVA